MCMEQMLAHPYIISLKNLSRTNNFSKLSKRKIVLTITVMIIYVSCMSRPGTIIIDI